MNVTTGKFGLDVPSEAGVGPLAREERGGLAGSRQAPSAGCSAAAQSLHSYVIPRGSATERRKPTRGTGAAEISREAATSFLCFSLLFPPPLPFSLLLPPPGSECPCAPRTGAAVRAAFPAPSPLPHSPSPPRRARRSRRRGRWRRPPAPAVPRGRSEEPEKPTEASREDAAAEDEPAERAVSPAGRSPEG